MSEYPAGPEDANKIPIYRSRIVLGTIGWFIGVISVLNPIVKITRTIPLRKSEQMCTMDSYPQYITKFFHHPFNIYTTTIISTSVKYFSIISQGWNTDKVVGIILII
jgi:hypothetical protein